MICKYQHISVISSWVYLNSKPNIQQATMIFLQHEKKIKLVKIRACDLTKSMDKTELLTPVLTPYCVLGRHILKVYRNIFFFTSISIFHNIFTIKVYHPSLIRELWLCLTIETYRTRFSTSLEVSNSQRWNGSRKKSCRFLTTQDTHIIISLRYM